MKIVIYLERQTNMARLRWVFRPHKGNPFHKAVNLMIADALNI